LIDNRSIVYTLDGKAAERLPSLRLLAGVSAERSQGRSALRALGDV
jgi:hypothetical protein